MLLYMYQIFSSLRSHHLFLCFFSLPLWSTFFVDTPYLNQLQFGNLISQKFNSCASDRLTDRPTNRQTVTRSFRDARMHLKKNLKERTSAIPERKSENAFHKPIFFSHHPTDNITCNLSINAV